MGLSWVLEIFIIIIMSYANKHGWSWFTILHYYRSKIRFMFLSQSKLVARSFRHSSLFIKLLFSFNSFQILSLFLLIIYPNNIDCLHLISVMNLWFSSISWRAASFHFLSVHDIVCISLRNHTSAAFRCFSACLVIVQALHLCKCIGTTSTLILLHSTLILWYYIALYYSLPTFYWWIHNVCSYCFAGLISLDEN